MTNINTMIDDSTLDRLICMSYNEKVINKEEFKLIDIKLYNKFYIYTLIIRNTEFNNYLESNRINIKKIGLNIYIKYYVIFMKQLKLKHNLDNVHNGILNLKRKISNTNKSNKKPCT